MRRSQQLHALAATARIANIPSVVSNVWLGIALGASATGGHADGTVYWQAAILGIAGGCLYLAGNFLNDWADRGWDAERRPERGLPQALFPAGFYLCTALASGALGLAAAAVIDRKCVLVALMIGLSIALYTRVHKRAAWSVIPLGWCRALLPVLGFIGETSAESGDHPARLTAALLACSGGLFLHVMGLSLSARRESFAGPPSLPAGFARGIFPVAAAVVFFASSQCLELPLLPCLLGLLPYGLWIALCLTVFRHPVAKHVSNLLAGIPLVDWIALLPLAMMQGSGGWTALAVTSLALPPAALLLGKGLQQMAPAT